MTLFAAIDANGWVLIISAIFIGIMQVVTFLKNAQDAREARADAKEAKEATKQVKVTLEQTTSATDKKLNTLTEVTDKTLEHVNHDRTMLLQTISMQARQLAEGPGATDVDRDIADKAQHMYQAHVANQAKMDAAAASKTATTSEIKDAVKEGMAATTLDVKTVNTGEVNTNVVNVKK